MSIPRAKDASHTDLRKRYHVIAKLGQGGMALVHLAVARGVGGVRKLVVLKSIRPDLVADARMRDMFLSEARIAATLNHPNIVQTFEVAVFGGRPVLVMEFLDGQSLSRVLHGNRRQRVPVSAQLYALTEVLCGLEYVHNQTDLDGAPLHLVHRDISPPNIFVTYDGHIKILDFGIAKNIAAASNTEAGVIKGKIRYMAPEQFVGSTALDRRADIFSVGVMLWEALTGKRLWDEVPAVQIMRNLVDGAMPAPSTVAADVAPALEAICEKALSHRPEDRYESAASMQGELEAAVHDLGLETTHRQVGKLVSELFAERRTSTKSALEGQLRDGATAPSVVLPDDGDGEDSDVSWPYGPDAEPWGLPTAVSVAPPRASRAALRRKPVLLGSIAAVGAVGVVVSLLALTHSRRDPRHELASTMVMPGPATPALPPASASAAPAAPRSISLSIRATPSRARFFLDDVLLGRNPFAGEVRSDSVRHELRVEARGYRSRTVVVTLGEPLDLDVELEPLAPTSAAAPASSASDVATRSCKPPFYFDGKGIKLYKLECLK